MNTGTRNSSTDLWLDVRVAELQRQLEARRESSEEVAGTAASRASRQAAISSGYHNLDCLLPAGGFQRGTLVEWLTDPALGGTGTLAMRICVNICLELGGSLVVLDRGAQFMTGWKPIPHMTGWKPIPQEFYAPAVLAWGIPAERLLVLRPPQGPLYLWALEQVLRCQAVTAVWAPLDRIEPREFRRLQLAAEQGRTLGMLVRPATFRGQPSWASVQMYICPQPACQGPACGPLSARDEWAFQVEITRVRSGVQISDNRTGKGTLIFTDSKSGDTHDP